MSKDEDGVVAPIDKVAGHDRGGARVSAGREKEVFLRGEFTERAAEGFGGGSTMFFPPGVEFDFRRGFEAEVGAGGGRGRTFPDGAGRIDIEDGLKVEAET